MSLHQYFEKKPATDSDHLNGSIDPPICRKPASRKALSRKPSVHDGLKPIPSLGSGDSYYLPAFLDSEIAKELFESIDSIDFIPRELFTMTLRGKEGVRLQRDKQIFGDRVSGADGSVSVPYFDYGADFDPVVQEWPECLLPVRDAVSRRVGIAINHCVCNRYVTGSDYIGYHHDKTRNFAPGTGIATITLGSPRTFCLKSVLGAGHVKQIDLQPGSLLFLGWKSNLEWKHSIPKRARVGGTRIGLTMRQIITTRPVTASVLHPAAETTSSFSNGYPGQKHDLLSK